MSHILDDVYMIWLSPSFLRIAEEFWVFFLEFWLLDWLGGVYDTIVSRAFTLFIFFFFPCQCARRPWENTATHSCVLVSFCTQILFQGFPSFHPHLLFQMKFHCKLRINTPESILLRFQSWTQQLLLTTDLTFFSLPSGFCSPTTKAFTKLHRWWVGRKETQDQCALSVSHFARVLNHTSKISKIRLQ